MQVAFNLLSSFHLSLQQTYVDLLNQVDSCQKEEQTIRHFGA
jgi:hypothetical protein